MSFAKNLEEFARIQFAPPKYLSMPTAGIDVSASGIKSVTVSEHVHGLELDFFKDSKLSVSSSVSTDTTRRDEIKHALAEISSSMHVHRANVALQESRGYLFEATVEGSSQAELRSAIEQHMDEYVPLPPAEVAFDAVPLGREGNHTHLIGVGCSRRVIDESLALFESINIDVRAIESETFALPRALLPHGDKETVLIIDIGKSSTKLLVVTNRLPRLSTTLDIGGHALTLAVQKYFGVTEEEAKRVKAEKGLIQGPDNGDYLAAMLSTASAIRDEVMRRIDYWDSRKSLISNYEPITRAILVGGNSTVRGLPEYLETALKVPVELGDVFTNFAPRASWLPPLDYLESLAFGTAIGLALREYVP